MQKTLSPVFLVGLQRSGTNMTVGSLDKSSDIKLFNENHEEAFTHFKLKEWDKIRYLLDKGEEEDAKIALFKPISDTPKTLMYLNQIPSLKVLFCFRNYEDVVNSHMKKFGNDGAALLNNYLKEMQDPKRSPLLSFHEERKDYHALEILKTFYTDTLSPNSTFALTWLFTNTLYFDFNLHTHEKVLPVCYEMTVSKPKLVFSTICSFLGVCYQDKLVSQIHGNSVKKDTKPAIDEKIENECRLLYNKLYNDTKKHYSNKYNLLSKILTYITKR